MKTTSSKKAIQTRITDIPKYLYETQQKKFKVNLDSKQYISVVIYLC